MKTSTTRFSFERRVKLIITFALMMTAFMLIPCFRSFSESTPVYGRTNLIRTSESTDNYAVIQCAENTIIAKGTYNYSSLKKMLILHYDESSGTYRIHVQKDGSFEAELTLVPEPGEHTLIFLMSSGAEMRYRIFYDNETGWYFPLNGIEKSNRKVFDHIFEAPDEASVLYLSSNDDPKEVNTALEQISALTESVTEGITDDYEKAKAISAFVTKTVYYDHDARETTADLDTIALYNVLRSSRSVCGGFANLFGAMAEAAGLDAVNIKGGVTSGDITYDDLGKGVQNHEWAAFYYNKEQRWVWVDCCWDGSGDYRNGTFTDGSYKLMYFDITDEAFSLNHRADKAERRHYFSAKPETEPLTEASAEEVPLPVTEDTGETTAEMGEAASAVNDTPADTTTQTSPSEAAESSAAPTTGSSADTVSETDAPETTGENAASVPQTLPEDNSNIYIIIITALSAAIAVVTAIIIKVISNGRKN